MNRHSYKLLLSTGFIILVAGGIATNAQAQSRDAFLQTYNSQAIYMAGKSYTKPERFIWQPIVVYYTSGTILLP